MTECGICEECYEKTFGKKYVHSKKAPEELSDHKFLDTGKNVPHDMVNQMKERFPGFKYLYTEYE